MSALSVERLARELETQRYGRSLEHLASTGSTNDDARRAALAGVQAGHVIVADAQHSGRGSRGRSWESPAASDLYLSIVDRLPVALAELPPLTLAVGLGVAEASDLLLRGTGAPASQVKWPNDVLIGGKKCAGVLIEASSIGETLDALVIGIGLNVNRDAFPEPLNATATSLRLASGCDPSLDRNRALCVLLQCVEHWVDVFVAQGAASVVQALTPKLALLGQRVRCDDALGVLRGVDPSGALRLETAGGIRCVIAGRIEPVA
jgi:BirA family transcriptional regulator, biotin operon repressor / biotin---[acetyl-CoA-carboxylase] ligase